MTSPRNTSLARGFVTADQAIHRTIKSGVSVLDSLLGGGLELGLVHLFYGDRIMYDDLLRMAVHAQLPIKKGGMASPSIVIDCVNMIRIETITDCALEMELDPDEVMNAIFITRAFNSSQVYDVVMNQLEHLFDQVPARLLLITGLPSLFISEGATGKSLQQISHMTSKIKAFTMGRNIATVITAASSKDHRVPVGGRSLTTNAQIHVHVKYNRSYVRYTLAKHPAHPVRHNSRSIRTEYGTTPPLSYFLKQRDEEK